MKFLYYVYILQIVFVPTIIYQIMSNLYFYNKVNFLSIGSLMILIWAIPRYNPLWEELKNKWKNK